MLLEAARQKPAEVGRQAALPTELECVHQPAHVAFVAIQRSESREAARVLPAVEADIASDGQPATVAAVTLGRRQLLDTGLAQEDAAGIAQRASRRVQEVER